MLFFYCVSQIGESVLYEVTSERRIKDLNGFPFMTPAEGNMLSIILALALMDKSAFKLTNIF